MYMDPSNLLMLGVPLSRRLPLPVCSQVMHAKTERSLWNDHHASESHDYAGLHTQANVPYCLLRYCF
jgi:hypothetical protein